MEKKIPDFFAQNLSERLNHRSVLLLAKYSIFLVILYIYIYNQPRIIVYLRTFLPIHLYVTSVNLARPRICARRGMPRLLLAAERLLWLYRPTLL